CCRGISFSNQILRTGDEIPERILFAKQFSIFIPGAAQILPAPHVRNRKDESPVQQREARRRKISIHRGSISSVSIQKQWILAVFLHPFAVYERNRYPYAVLCRSPNAFFGVRLFVKRT